MHVAVPSILMASKRRGENEKTTTKARKNHQTRRNMRGGDMRALGDVAQAALVLFINGSLDKTFVSVLSVESRRKKPLQNVQ